MSPILTVLNLSTGYDKKQVLFDVTFDVMPGETLLITGGNGSGKSTLLKAIYGLLSPWNTNTEVFFRPTADGPALKTQCPIVNLSNGLAYVPQNSSIFNSMTVEDNFRLAGHSFVNDTEFTSRCTEILASFSLLRPLLKCRADKLSGGQRKMVALGMVLLRQPKLLLLDEPTAGLDAKNTESILHILRESTSKLGLTLVIVEHRSHQWNVPEQRRWRMRLGKLTNGLSVADAVPNE